MKCDKSELKAYEAYICSHEFLSEEAPKDCEAIVSSNSRYAKDDWWDNAKEFECYLKSEADKVIAEKNTKIIQLEALIENYNRISSEIIDNANHQKYKRCLAMADLCHWKMGVFIYKKDKNDFYWRWHNRWLKIAEQFKEVK